MLDVTRLNCYIAYHSTATTKMFQTLPLHQVASVRTAMVFRDAPPKETPDGNVYALAIRDILAGWPVRVSRLPRISIPDHLVRHCLTESEVVIPSRGDYYLAQVFAGPARTIFPLGQINIISPMTNLSGAYLAWYLNQDDAQRYIVASATGTNIKALNKRTLLEMPIPIPPLDVQNRISALQVVWAQIKEKRARLLEVEEGQLNALCAGLLSRQDG